MHARLHRKPKTFTLWLYELYSPYYTNKIVNIEKRLFLHLLFTWWAPYSGLSRAIVEASLPNTVLIHTICATPCAHIFYFVIWKLRSKIITSLNCRKILNFPYHAQYGFHKFCWSYLWALRVTFSYALDIQPPANAAIKQNKTFHLHTMRHNMKENCSYATIKREHAEPGKTIGGNFCVFMYLSLRIYFT